MDIKTRNYITEINKEIDKKQKRIFSVLLKITQGIKDGTLSKEKEEELFNEISILKTQIKDNSNRIKEVKNNPELIFDGITSDFSLYGSEPGNDEDKINSEELLNTIDELTKSLQNVSSADKSDSLNINEKNNYNRKSRLGNLEYNEEEGNGSVFPVENDNSSGKNNELISIETNSFSYKIKRLFVKFENLLKRN